MYAIDGKISKISKHFFHSMYEHFPWLELAMSVQNIVGVKIVARDCCGSRLKNLEVRAGMERVPDNLPASKKRLTLNTMVAKFKGPVRPLKPYQICFHKLVCAKYITLQIIGTSILEINEVAPILPGDGMCNNVVVANGNINMGLTVKLHYSFL